MNEELSNNELFRTSHIMILICYSIFSVILISEALLLGWEKWALVMIACGLLIAWFIHFHQNLSTISRLWVYSLLMMATYFFYGIHQTSTFDLSTVMTAVIVLYTMTGLKPLVTLCEVTFFVTFAYDIVELLRSGTQFDSLMITRSMLHCAIIFMVGWIGRIIIDRWDKVLNRSRDEIIALKEGTERLNDFLANVSHELRTPVNAIIGLTNICMEKESDPSIKSDMASVVEAGRRVGEQIGDILDYSEIDRGRLVTTEEEYMLSSVINDLGMELAPLQKDGVEMMIDVSTSTPMVLKGDVAKIKKVIHHLVINGLKYTKVGGVNLRIFPIFKEYGINLCIEVSDTGIGMEDNEKEMIFEGFYQGDSSRVRSGGGLGLGLSIVNGFVESMGGFVAVKSKPGNGSMIRVSIPQKVVDSEPCMSLANRSELCLGAFLNFDKFNGAVCREYYNEMMKNVVSGLGVRIHRVDSLDDLKTLCSSMDLTHLLIGWEEYSSATEYMEELAEKTVVVVAARNTYVPMISQKMRVMQKPISSFDVVENLNRKLTDSCNGSMRIAFPNVRALVVDDEPMNLVVAKEIFGRYEMEVFTVSSGYEAIDVCKTTEFDIIFMDHMMPGMDGIETMKRLRAMRSKNSRKIPIVALTANAVSSAKEMFFSVGFDGFISKPVELHELERVMRRVLDRFLVTVKVNKEEPLVNAAPKGHAVARLSDEIIEPIPTAVSAESVQEPAEHVTTQSAWYDALSGYGFNTLKGVTYCGGDEEFYRMLVEQFVIDSVEKREKIVEAYANKDHKNAEIVVHGLKSTARMIGAEQLSDMAKALEEASSREEEWDAAAYDELLGEYDRITLAITGVIGLNSVENKEESKAHDNKIMEFAPESDEDILEFEPGTQTDAARVTPEGNDGVMEFMPESEREIFTFEPAEDSDD